MGAAGSPVARTLRAALTSSIALGYLGLVFALLVWAAVVSAAPSPDASFAGIWPVLATAPLSLFALLLPLPDHPGWLVVSVALCGLVNAVAVGWCHRTLGRRREDR
ncbi:hypothetical protein HCJ92_10795 [Streptomyces sp. ventii]|uniref:Integral membrane protein n=1 Tax=Streptomyces spiramenti TaxID=2720606 RepID=A0ABX1AMW7_9ACTN|nr:hypothetical protein [Streptomyces spiramenti]